MTVIRVAIVNVTGYTGAELMRILSRHPEVKVVAATGRSDAGKALRQVFPSLRSVDREIVPGVTDTVDVVFLALPHHASAEAAPPFVAQGAKIIDLSADFRISDVAVYEQWYGAHPLPQLLGKAVYGLPELHRAEIKGAQIVGNPGCYPTASILALAPALQAGIISPRVIVDAKSGISGAGRSLKLDSHFSEVDENVTAYGLAGHRHMPEIAQELTVAWQRGGRSGDVILTFIPHLIPMTRGILAAAYADLTAEVSDEQIRRLYSDFYAAEPFVQVTDAPPSTKQVWGSNFCFVYPVLEKRTGRLIVISVIDNLVKGAAGQAVQNMNLVCGLPETTGLEALPYYP
jgi:N-acetyl-gamma-glutamyl-phosphate reductase